MLVLVIGIKRILGKNWLIAFAVITLVATFASLAIPPIAKYGEVKDVLRLYDWYKLISMFSYFGPACLATFLFVNWSASRMTLDIKSLLFSFSGRIPRSAFWIAGFILFPLGTALGANSYNSNAEGLLKILIWTVYFCWLIPSTWISLAIYIKRFHDCSKSGWMVLVSLIPVIGLLWLIGYLGFVRGADGPNQYGDNLLNTQKA